ncbi:MAG: hypothetical protein ABIH34_01400 [Nanoarchaeota archaeon]
MKNKKEERLENPIVAIIVPMSGIFLVIVLFFLLFGKNTEGGVSTAALSSLVKVAWAYAVLGIGASFFAYKMRK